MTNTNKQTPYLIAIAAATANKTVHKGTYNSLSTPDSITVTSEKENIIVIWLTKHQNKHHYRIHHTDQNQHTTIYHVNATKHNNEIIINGLHKNHTAHIKVTQQNTTNNENTYHNTITLKQTTPTKELTPA